MPYKSQGTVRMETVRGNHANPMNWTLIFVPDDIHLVKRNNREYAVFVDWESNLPHHGRVINLVDPTTQVRGVPITVGHRFLGQGASNLPPDTHGRLAIQLLSSVLETQRKVEVTVDILPEAGENVTLVGFVLPAT